MKMHHRPRHWIAVALVLAALLLTLSEVHGQSTGSAAMSEVQGGDAASLSDKLKPPRDQSVAKDQRSSAKKVKRAAKRTATRSRHGVSEIDSEASKPSAR